MASQPSPPASISTTIRTLGASLLVASVFASCSINPATGKRQLSLISEQQEIAMGREADQQISQQLGLYDNEEVQAYIAALGRELAAESERPDLPWTFRVVDDETVNAFALPGGFIYVTRGILTHMGSKAELAGVLGHEIGHVTARHSVNQMSKGMLAQLGLGIGSVVSPEFASLAGLAETGLSLLFLKYGRDDERQADDLAFRYSVRSGYDPRSLVEVFELLERVSQRSEGGSLPNWLATHPQPVARREEAEKLLATVDVDLDDLEVAREPFLRRIDGMVYGADPRQGYFRDERFLHPEMQFELRFPKGWRTMNLRQAVVAQQPDGQAVVVLTLAAEGDAEAAARAFASQGVEPLRQWRDRINGQRAVSYYFGAKVQTTPIAGLATFVEHRGRVFRLLGYTAEARLREYDREFEHSLESFRRLEDRRVLSVQPLRIEIERLGRATTIERLAESYDRPVSLEQLALLNNVEPGERLEAGSWVKKVVGQPPP
ncbi:MAG TPA: M48 family metalloprotease [Thermoanaerobaculia bacterium]|nr:M48 family metalloprotease [Thermoanaerobaculia bacterium]